MIEHITKTKLQKLVIVFLLSFFYSVEAFALPNCFEIISHFINKFPGVQNKEVSFSPWSLTQMQKLTPSHFLPQSFIDQVEKTSGELYLKVEKNIVNPNSFFSRFDKDALSFWILKIGVKDEDEFVTCMFMIDPNDQRSIVVTGLELINPIPATRNGRIHLSQVSKGVPYPVFIHLKKQLILYLKAGNYNKIKSLPQTYLVSKFYRRMLGFQPADEKSQETFDEVDNLYNASKLQLKEFKKYTTMDQFSRALGDHRMNNPGRPFSEVTNFEKDIQDSPHEFFNNKTPIYSSINNELIGFITNSQENPHVYFFRPKTNSQSILNWKDLISTSSIELVLEI